MQTFLREDGAEGWPPPDGFTVIPEAELPDGWQWVDATAAPDWDGFRRLALGSTIIAAAMAAARTNDDPDLAAAGVPPGEPAATYLAAAYDAAAAGDLSRLEAVWPVLVVRGGISVEDRAQLAQHAEALNLPAALVAILRGP